MFLGKMAQIQKKEGSIWTPPNRYGPSFPFWFKPITALPRQFILAHQNHKSQSQRFSSAGAKSRQLCRKSAIFARNSQNRIAITSNGNNSHLQNDSALEITAISGLRWIFAFAIAKVARFRRSRLFMGPTVTSLHTVTVHFLCAL